MNSTDEQNPMIIKEENLPTGENTKKTPVRDFFGNAINSLKGRDVNQMLEEFTSQMTLIAEGLSDDQERLDRENARLQSQQTLLEDDELKRHHDLSCMVEENRQALEELKAQLDKVEKQLTNKKVSKVAGFTALLKQATWLAGVLAGAWIIITIIRMF